MKNKKYELVTLIFVLLSILILALIDRSNNINMSVAIQFIIILYLIKVSYGCILYIRKIYKDNKYSYSIIMNLGLLLFLIINILRQINLLIINWNSVNIKTVFLNTLDSFSYFAMIVLPFIAILSAYSVLTNIFLIKKEGLKKQNVLGILFGVIVIAIVVSGQLIYVTAEKLNLTIEEFYIKKLIDISLNSVLSYFYCLILATLYCNIMAGKYTPKYDKDFVIILGCKIRPDGTLTPLLKGRVDKAIEFAKNQKEKTNKDIIYIPSGGKGNDEVISESEAIKKYLIENGIDKKNIIIENKSENTRENLIYSKEKIDKLKKDGKIVFATTNYHVFRSGVIACKEKIDCEGIGSKTKWYFYTNALIREFIANLVLERNKHFFLITSINISIVILILIGYYYNLV